MKWYDPRFWRPSAEDGLPESVCFALSWWQWKSGVAVYTLVLLLAIVGVLTSLFALVSVPTSIERNGWLGTWTISLIGVSLAAGASTWLLCAGARWVAGQAIIRSGQCFHVRGTDGRRYYDFVRGLDLL